MAAPGLEVGTRLRAKYIDGVQYRAEVIAISESKKRAKAPVKVRFDGYDESSDTWLPLEDLSSRALRKAAAQAGKSDGTAKGKAKAKAKPEAKAKAKSKARAKAKAAEAPDPNKTPCDELIIASWVIPIEGEVQQDAAIAVRDGLIIEVLAAAEAEAKYSPKRRSNLPGKALMPGFVNAHTHASMVYMRGISDDIMLHEWLTGTVWPMEGALADEDFCREGATLAAAEMIRSGTTCAHDMYFFPGSTLEAWTKVGFRGVVGIICIEFPFPKYGMGPDDFISKGLAAMAATKDNPLVRWDVAAHAPYTVTDATFLRLKEITQTHSLKLHIHLHETAAECEESEKGNTEHFACHKSDQKCTPLKNLDRLGLADSRLIAVHMTCLKDEEIELLAKNGSSVVHCPTSNMKLASGVCRVADLLKAGVNVALGTDGASSHNSLDMLGELKLAAILAKQTAKDPTVVPAAQALRMATLNGAKALGLDDKIGSLVPGKAADIIAIDVDTVETLPSPCTVGPKGFDPVTHIVYSSTRDQVTDVWVAGKRLLRGRRLTTVRTKVLRDTAKKWSDKVMEIAKPESPKE